MIDNMNPLNVGDCIKATFVTELPVRFRCIISIAGEEKECYVPSSCKLEPLIKLKNKEVLVRKQDSGKTSLYSLVAVKHKSNYVLLNSSYANQLFMESVARRLFGFLGKRKKVISEYTLSDYRCDFYIEDTNTIIEVKSIISDKDKVFFPAMESKRFLHQLSTIKANMIAGKKSNLIVIVMNPYLKEIDLNKCLQCYELIKECMELGMTVRAFKCRLSEGKFEIVSSVKIRN